MSEDLARRAGARRIACLAALAAAALGGCGPSLVWSGPRTAACGGSR